MKKIAVLFLSMLVLLSGCAAVGEGVGVRYGLGNAVISAEGETLLDLTGVNVTAEAAGNGDVTGVRLAFNTIGGTFAQAVLAAKGDQVILSLEGPDLNSVYVTDNTEDAQALEGLFSDTPEGDDAPAPEGEESDIPDPDWEALGLPVPEWGDMDIDDGIVEALLKEIEELGGDEDTVTAEQQAAAEEILAACVQEAGTREIDGVTYNITEIHADHGDMAKLLDLFSDEEAAVQFVIESDYRAELTGEWGKAVGEDGTAFLDLTLTIRTAEKEEIVASFSMDGRDPAATSVSVDLAVEGESVLTADVDFMSSSLEDAPWLDIDLTDAVVVDEDNGREAAEQLWNDLLAFGRTGLGAVLNGDWP